MGHMYEDLWEAHRLFCSYFVLFNSLIVPKNPGTDYGIVDFYIN